MKTVTEKVEKALLRKFHTLCGQLGISDEEKRDIVRSYGYDSSRDLTAHDLMDICDKLDRLLHPDFAEMDKWRKRLMGSIGGWLKAMGRTSDANTIKSIACRAAKKTRFNEIPLGQLRSLYYAFLRQSKDMAVLRKITLDEFDALSILN